MSDMAAEYGNPSSGDVEITQESDYITRLKSTFNARLGQEATMQRQVIQQCPRPGVLSTQTTPQGVYVGLCEKDRDKL